MRASRVGDEGVDLSVLHRGGGVAAAVATTVLSAFGHSQEAKPSSPVAIAKAKNIVVNDVLSGHKECFAFGHGRVTHITCLPETRR